MVLLFGPQTDERFSARIAAAATTIFPRDRTTPVAPPGSALSEGLPRPPLVQRLSYVATSEARRASPGYSSKSIYFHAFADVFSFFWGSACSRCKLLIHPGLFPDGRGRATCENPSRTHERRYVRIHEYTAPIAPQWSDCCPSCRARDSGGTPSPSAAKQEGGAKGGSSSRVGPASPRR